MEPNDMLDCAYALATRRHVPDQWKDDYAQEVVLIVLDLLSGDVDEKLAWWIAERRSLRELKRWRSKPPVVDIRGPANMVASRVGRARDMLERGRLLEQEDTPCVG